MIYTKRTKLAMELCIEAHQGQVDKGGYPYILHPIHLAESMDDESETIVAFLHDVLEDCPEYTMEILEERIGLTEQEKESLRLITHDKSVPYMEYCQKLSLDPIARKVKVADLRHNLDYTRMEDSKERSEKMREYYDCYCYLVDGCWDTKQTMGFKHYNDLFSPLSEKEKDALSSEDVISRLVALTKAKGFHYGTIGDILYCYFHSGSKANQRIMTVDRLAELLCHPDFTEGIFYYLVTD